MIQPERPPMSAEKLLEIRDELAFIGVEIILDGGWGTDALLGEQTRSHKDVDFLINKSDLDKVNDFFASRGYKPSEDEPAKWWHFVLEGPDATVDIHVIDIDESGKGIYGPVEHNAFFPADALAGVGHINGMEVRCLTAEYRIICLTYDYGIVAKDGYQMNEKDYLDMAAVAAKFKLELPRDYVEYRASHLA